MDKMQKYYNDLFEYGNKENIYKIPKEYQTQEMWNKYVNETHTCPAYIPKEFQTQEMWNEYVARRHPNLEKIPKEFLTQKMWEDMANRLVKSDDEYRSYKIPSELQTQEMWDKYVEKTNISPIYVPKEFQTQEMWNGYVSRTHINFVDLNKVPKEFRTQELYDLYEMRKEEWKERTKKGKKKRSISGLERKNKSHTKEERNKKYELILENIEDYLNEHDKSKIPKEMFTQNFWDKYITSSNNLTLVPYEYRNRIYYKEYIKQGGDIRNVPEEYLNSSLCNSYIQQGGNVLYVPEEYLNDDLLRIVDEIVKTNESLTDYLVKMITDEEEKDSFKSKNK